MNGLDLHIGVDPGLRVEAAHDIGCEVERRLLTTLTDVADVIVHSEPARTTTQLIPEEAIRLNLGRPKRSDGEQP